MYSNPLPPAHPIRQEHACYSSQQTADLPLQAAAKQPYDQSYFQPTCSVSLLACMIGGKGGAGNGEENARTKEMGIMLEIMNWQRNGAKGQESMIWSG